jgi:hypothetical protein
MRATQKLVWLLAAAFVLALLEIAAGAEMVKHSGTLLAVDRTAGTVTLGELGPWRVERGVTQVDRLTVVVTSGTEFARVRRGEGDAAYFRDWVEEPLAAWSVRAGDFVTIDCRHEGRRMVAVKVTVVTPDQ